MPAMPVLTSAPNIALNATPTTVEAFRPSISSGPRPSLKPGSLHYHLARAVYDGAQLADACKALGVKPNTAHCIMHRLRRRASAYAGREVSETFALRLLFDAQIGLEAKVRDDRKVNNESLLR